MVRLRRWLAERLVGPFVRTGGEGTWVIVKTDHSVIWFKAASFDLTTRSGSERSVRLTATGEVKERPW